MFRHKIVTKEGAWAAIAGIVVVSAGMGVSRATGPEPTPTMVMATEVTRMMTPMTGATGAEPMTMTMPMAMLAPFTWTGNTSNAWNNAANWSGAGVGYPDDSSDDATFNGCGFRAEFDASRTIDDLTVDITGEFCLGYFDANDSEVTLTCDTVTITGGNDAVRVVEKAGIETN